MDTKKLFLRTQDNVFKWAVGFSGVIGTLSIYSSITKKVPLTTLICSILMVAVPMLLVLAKQKKQSRLSLIAIFAFALPNLFNMVQVMLVLPSTMAAAKAANPSFNLALFSSVSVAVYLIVYAAMVYFFYRAHVAIKNIIALSEDSKETFSV